MLVVLITGIANAQDVTFDFKCDTTEEELTAMYASDDYPTELGAATAAEAALLQQHYVNNFLPKLNKFGANFTTFANSTLTYTLIGDINADGIGVNTNVGRRRAVALEIIQKIWLLDHTNYNALEDAIYNIYEAAHPPTSLAAVINTAAVEANDQAVSSGNDSRVDFISLFNKYGLEFTGFDQANNANSSLIAKYDNNTDFPSVQIPNGSNELNEDSFKAWALAIAQAIWHYGHPTYEADIQFKQDRVDEILAIAIPENEIYGVTITFNNDTFRVKLDGKDKYVFNIDETFVEEDGVAFNTWKSTIQQRYNTLVNPLITAKIKADRIAEILAIDVNAGVSITQSATTFFISNGDTANISEVAISNAILENADDTDFNIKKTEVQTAYGDQVTKFATRTARISTLENKGNGYVTVAHTSNDNVGDLFNITYGNTAQPIYVDDYYGLGYARLENLVTSQFDALSTAITAKVNDLSPSVEKELNAFATGNKPTGSAPEWLPTALYDAANTKGNGTVRTAFLVSLSGHGVNITHILNDASHVTHFRISTGDGYDYIINWAPYTSGGWNQMTAESFRRLVFDVIVLKWKKIHETHNTERSDILDQTLDTDDIDVILVTYADDWWIYFNNTGVPILSGGRPLDPMFHNKFTLNPHDTYMTEAEFQKLVVFVTYMRDNYTRLKGITGKLDRHSEILTMATVEFGATVSPLVSNGDGTYHYTFNKNGNSNMYPVQTNWTHPAGTSLESLSPDNFVKLYAKARGILIGL